jgi:hypothetical protein
LGAVADVFNIVDLPPGLRSSPITTASAATSSLDYDRTTLLSSRTPPVEDAAKAPGYKRPSSAMQQPMTTKTNASPSKEAADNIGVFDTETADDNRSLSAHANIDNAKDIGTIGGALLSSLRSSDFDLGAQNVRFNAILKFTNYLLYILESINKRWQCTNGFTYDTRVGATTEWSTATIAW